MALGLSLGEVGALVVVRGMCGVFIHSNVRLDPGWLRFVVGAPAACTTTTTRATRRRSPTTPTWRRGSTSCSGPTPAPPGPRPYALGVVEPAPRGYLALLVWPFRRAAPTGAARRSRPARRVEGSGQGLVATGDEAVAGGAAQRLAAAADR
ncbi:MAG: hypothetical protein HS111_26810 [Kofleriaceae bacterium]|nr:hypothetical protein [Kofleriaceae bacterium]